jgi:hypothetical protein
MSSKRISTVESGDAVRLLSGPVRYQGRVGLVVDKNRRGKKTFYGLSFFPRRATPLYTTRSNIVPVE